MPREIGEFFRDPGVSGEGEEKAEASNRNGNYGSRISLIHVCLTCVRNGKSVRNKLIALAARLIKRAISLMAVRRGCGAVGH